ncbi:MAG TPA: hypothetical protein VF194_16240 [Ferrovibrio sp.]|uniref:hypothetical protein n=1 Tax=Ferrovibrio sp. TaxID=1917215 RepID=UPI002ED09E96
MAANGLGAGLRQKNGQAGYFFYISDFVVDFLKIRLANLFVQRNMYDSHADVIQRGWHDGGTPGAADPTRPESR